MEDNPLETQAKIHTELSINPPEAHVKIKRYGTVPTSIAVFHLTVIIKFSMMNISLNLN